MSARAALLVTLLAAAPAAAGPPKPFVVAQARPVGRLVADLKELARAAAAPKDADAAVAAVVKGLEEAFGEKGFEGIDLDRPLGLYATVREPFADSSLVLVVPVGGEKEFLDLIDRAGGRARPVEGKKGLFTLDLPADVFEKQSYLRVAGGWAYLGFNADEVADPANLVPTAELFDPKEAAQFAARVYPNRFPAKLLKTALDEIADGVGQLKQLLPVNEPHVTRAIDAVFDGGLKLFRRTAEGLHADAKEVAVRFAFDPLTADAAAELVVTPKPGTPLAKDVAARPATANRFAGLVPPDAAAAVVGQSPAFSPEVRAIADAFLEMQAVESVNEVPESAKKAVGELYKAVGRALKAGNEDFAFALAGPNKDGLFTLVAGLPLDDPAAVEKELRAVVKGMGFLKLIAFDVDRANGVSIHRATVPLLDQPELARVFGKVVPLGFALTPAAGYVAFGPDAMDRVKAAVAAKPGPAPAAGVSGNPARLAKLAAAATDDPTGKRLAAVLGAEDKLLDGLTLTLSGGAALRVRLAANVKRLPRLLANAEDIGGP